MRPPDDVQRAHDLLVGVILGEVDGVAADDRWYAAVDVLCWILRHDHNQAFSDNLANLQAATAAAGYVVIRSSG